MSLLSIQATNPKIRFLLSMIPFSPLSILSHGVSLCLYADKNLLMAMLRREVGLTEKINERTIDDLSSDAKTKGKMASLAPYIAEIEVRVPRRSVASGCVPPTNGLIKI